MSRRGLQVFVELPSPRKDLWRYKSAAFGGTKIKQEEEDDEVQFLRVVEPSKKKVKKERAPEVVDVDAVQVKLEETAVDLSRRIKKFKLDEANEADEDTVQGRIDAIPITHLVTQLTQAEQDHTVDRQLLCDHYKGAEMVKTNFLMSRPGSVLGSQHTSILAANRDMNPYIPTQPGKNGLMFDADIATTETPDQSGTPHTKHEDAYESMDEDKPEVIPTGTDTKPGDVKDEKKSEQLDFRLVFAHLSPCHWRYVGRYEVYPLKQLTVAEWSRQPTAFKEIWASRMLTEGYAASLREQVYRWQRLRRRLHRDPTKDELRAEITLLSAANQHKLTRHDILNAFEKGFISIHVEAVRFVSYDDAFQRELIQFDVDPEPLPEKAARVAERAIKRAAKLAARQVRPVRRVGPKSTKRQRPKMQLGTLQGSSASTPSQKRGLVPRKRTRETDDDSQEEDLQPARKLPRRSTGRGVPIQDGIVDSDDEDSDYVPIRDGRRQPYIS